MATPRTRQERIAALAEELRINGIEITPEDLAALLTNDLTRERNGISNPVYNLAQQIGADPQVLARSMAAHGITGNIDPRDDIVSYPYQVNDAERGASRISNYLSSPMSGEELNRLMEWANDRAESSGENPLELLAERLGIDQNTLRRELKSVGFVVDQQRDANRIVYAQGLHHDIGSPMGRPTDLDVLLNLESPAYHDRYEQNRARFEQNKDRLHTEALNGLTSDLRAIGVSVSPEEWERRLEAANDKARDIEGDALSILALDLGIPRERLQQALEQNGFVFHPAVIMMSEPGMYGIAGSYRPVEFSPGPEVMDGVDPVVLNNPPQFTIMRDGHSPWRDMDRAPSILNEPEIRGQLEDSTWQRNGAGTSVANSSLSGEIPEVGRISAIASLLDENNFKAEWNVYTQAPQMIDQKAQFANRAPERAQGNEGIA